ncbi:hypothetical protein STEG23_021438 [Scotinomys teguina]
MSSVEMSEVSLAKGACKGPEAVQGPRTEAPNPGDSGEESTPSHPQPQSFTENHEVKERGEKFSTKYQIVQQFIMKGHFGQCHVISVTFDSDIVAQMTQRQYAPECKLCPKKT